MGVVPRRTLVTGAVLLAVLVAASALMRIVATSDGDAAAAISTAGAVAFAAFAGVTAFAMALRLQRGEPLRVQVLAIGLGMAALIAGDVAYWFIESVLGMEPYPSVADAFYLASFPLLGGGLILALRAFSRGARPTIPVAAAGAASAAATVVVWFTVLQPLIADPGVGGLEKALGAMYPLGDVWLLLFPSLALAIALGRFAGGRLAVPWMVVAAGALAMAGVDTAYTWMDYAGSYSSGSLVDAGWWIAYAAIGLGLATLAEVQGIGGRGRS